MASLNEICNIAAAKVLGIPGMMVQEVFDGAIIKEPFKVAGLGLESGRIEVYSRNTNDVLGSYRATGFRKAKL